MPSSSPLQRNPNDFGVHSVPPTRPKDPRVRLAEEDSLQAWMTAWMVHQVKKPEWLSPVSLSFGSDRRLNLSGTYHSSVHPADLEIATAITLPALESLDVVVKKADRLYLVVFGAVVGGEQDPLLSKISFKYLDKTDPLNPVLTPVEKENAKRDRAFWCLVLSPNALTAETFNQSLPQEPIGTGQTARLSGDRYLSILDTTDSGFLVSGLRVFAKDPLLTIATYPILSDFIDVVEIAQIPRIQKYTDRGYTWGFRGEEPLSSTYNLIPIATPRQPDQETRIRSRLYEIFSGTAGKGSGYGRTVQNLTAGLVAGNEGRAGESAASPNDSVCLANGDRISFTNQAFAQSFAVQILTVQNDGSGNPVVTATLQANSPAGTYFSEKPTDHKIFKADGTEQSALGRFINTGNALTWIGSANASLRTGQQCYVMPEIRYAAGSGFEIPFRAVENVWVGGTPLDAANIRYGELNDLEAYADPAAGQDYIVVMGRERAALHYILHKISISADSNGVAVVPGTSRGCFALIEGIVGRIDAPVKSGLTPNATYKALLYHAPLATEAWQFQFSYANYQGLSTIEPDFLNGAIVSSKAYCFLNVQGGGNSVFQGDARTRYSPIAMHLPRVNSGMNAYELDAPLQLFGEVYPGPVSLREITPLPGAGLALPSPGVALQLVTNTGLGSGKSLNAALKSNGQAVGMRSPLINGRAKFQTILAFTVQKNGQERLVIATRNGGGNESIPLDSNAGNAFDLFRV